MTDLADIRLAAQERADRVNAATITTAEWNRYINASAAGLYRTLNEIYEDFNTDDYNFTLKGGDTGNSLLLGPGGPVPKFDKLRHLASNISAVGSTMTFAPVLKADSLFHFDQLSAPVLNTYYGTFIQVFYWLFGRKIEIRPSASAGLTYRLYYTPSFTKLVNDTDTIDGTWMANNGIDEFIVLGAAAKALIKEESLDTANLILQEQSILRTDILKQFANRDDNQPGRIADIKRSRAYMGMGAGRWGI